MKKSAVSFLLVALWTGMGLLAPGQSVAQSLASPSGLSVQEIQLAQARNQRTLSLHFSQPPDSVYAFSLHSPARLVIDVIGEVERSASATHPASDALITRVRVGSHPHHTRFVLDLKAEQLPPFSVEQQAHVVTAILNGMDEPDNPNDTAEQAGSLQHGNTQVLFARLPKASSQSIPPRPAQTPASPAPTALAKKVTKKAPSPPLHRATPPASTSRVTPDKEVPAQAVPLPAAAKERRAAIPLKAPPTSVPLPLPAPVGLSPDTPQPPPIVPAPTVLVKKGIKKSPSPLPQVTPPVPTPRVTPAREDPARATLLPATSQERRAATPLKATPRAVPRSPAPTPSPQGIPQLPLASPAPTVLAKKVTKKAAQPPPRQATPPTPTLRVTPARGVPAQAVPLPSAAKEQRKTILLKALPTSAPPLSTPTLVHPSPDTPQPPPASSVPTVLAKKVTKKSPSLPLRQATPPAPAPRMTPAREGPAQATSLPSAPQGLRAAIPLKDTPPAASRLPAPAPSISPPDTPQPQPVPATAAQHLRQGYTLYNQGNIDGAIRQWRQAVDHAPSHAEAHYRIGIALQERGELPQAITALREATRLNPDNATIHIHLARACEAAGNTQDALAAYRKALQLVPTSAHVHHRIGHVLAAQGDLAGAVQAWRQTIHLQPDYAYAYVSLGRVLGQSGQKNEAVAVYEQALQLDPRAPFVAEVRQQIARLRAAGP